MIEFGQKQLWYFLWFCWYLYTFSKNDVISSVRKRYCALGLGLELAEITFSVKRVFEQVQ